MSLLVNHEIVNQRKLGNVIIEPFREHQLNTVSYDVRLGQHVAWPAWSDGPLDLSSKDVLQAFRIEDLKPDGSLVLPAGARCLAHTDEFIGGRRIITTQMNARSSFGRLGMLACSCAGFGDVGYFNRWTAELKNENPFPVRIWVGTLFAQISFSKVDMPSHGSEYGRVGQYQQGQDLKALQRDWRPEQMLPKPLHISG